MLYHAAYLKADDAASTQRPFPTGNAAGLGTKGRRVRAGRGGWPDHADSGSSLALVQKERVAEGG